MRCKRGFTLVELIVSVAVLSFLAFVIAPGFQAPLGEAMLNATARQIAQDLRRTQQLAVTNGESYRFEIHVANKVYNVRPQNPLKSALFTVRVNRPITSVTSNFQYIGGGWRGITYTPTGIPGQTGEIVITDSRGRGRAIVVAVATGRAQVRIR